MDFRETPYCSYKRFTFLLQNNEYLEERLLLKGPTISQRSKKVGSLLTISLLTHRCYAAMHAGICPVKLCQGFCEILEVTVSVASYVGAPRAWVEWSSPQDRGRRVGMERR